MLFRLEVLVCVEGLRTEEVYLDYLVNEYSDRVRIRFGRFRGTPLPLVRHAVDTKVKAEYDAKHERGRAFDQVWCVFDRDEHPCFEEALSLALANDIRLAVSNPCIELWFALHFQDQHAFLDRSRAQILSKVLLNCDKNLTDSALRTLDANFPSAKARAIELDNRHKRNRSPAASNPSTSVWKLIDVIAPHRALT